MKLDIKEEGKFHYAEMGKDGAEPIVLLHGLLGGASNFDDLAATLASKGYKIYFPVLPIYSLSLLKTTVSGMVSHIREFIRKKKIERPVFIGNSLGGHVSLVYAKKYQSELRGMILTGSSGLYEAAGHSYPRRGDYDYVMKKAQEVFFDPKVASRDLVDEVYSIVNNRLKAAHVLSLSKSAMRHNVEKNLPKLTLPVCLIWGKNDAVTPPDVADTFHRLLPDSELHWIEKCGHAAMMEHPRIFSRLTLDWLSRLREKEEDEKSGLQNPAGESPVG